MIQSGFPRAADFCRHFRSVWKFIQIALCVSLRKAINFPQTRVNFPHESWSQRHAVFLIKQFPKLIEKMFTQIIFFLILFLSLHETSEMCFFCGPDVDARLDECLRHIFIFNEKISRKFVVVERDVLNNAFGWKCRWIKKKTTNHNFYEKMFKHQINGT